MVKKGRAGQMAPLDGLHLLVTDLSRGNFGGQLNFKSGDWKVRVVI